MKNISAIIILLFLMLYIISCTSKENNNSKPHITTANSVAKQLPAIKQEEKPEKMDNRQITTHITRKYIFPSMMIKNDMRHCEKEGDFSCTPLLRNLVVNRWEASGDNYRRSFIYTSPEMTYSELMDYLHFDDRDVTYAKAPKAGEPQASIRTEWLTCNITFLNKVYDGKDKSVKLKAVIIDNEVKANSVRETEYDKNKGIIRKVLDLFKVVHKP